MGFSRAIDVVGRGIVGLGVAYKLRKAGYRVRVIGPQASEDQGCASRVATGVVSLKGLNRTSENPLFRLKIEGQASVYEFIREFERDLIKFEIFPPHSNVSLSSLSSDREQKIFNFGIFEPLRDKNDFAATHKRVHHGVDFQNFGNQFISGQPHPLDSFLYKNSAPLFGSFFYPQDIYFSCGYLLDNLEKTLGKLGVVFCNTRITSLQSDGYDASFLTSSGENFEASRLICFCTGPRTQEILESSSFCDQKMSAEMSQKLSINVGQKLTGTRIIGNLENQSLDFGNLVNQPPDQVKNLPQSICMKKNSYGFIRTNDWSRQEECVEFQLPKLFKLASPKEALVEAYSQETCLNFSSVLADFPLEQMNWKAAERLRAPDRMPWVEKVAKIPSEKTGSTSVFVATAMHKSGYQLFWKVAAKVLELIESDR